MLLDKRRVEFIFRVVIRLDRCVSGFFDRSLHRGLDSLFKLLAVHPVKVKNVLNTEVLSHYGFFDPRCLHFVKLLLPGCGSSQLRLEVDTERLQSLIEFLHAPELALRHRNWGEFYSFLPCCARLVVFLDDALNFVFREVDRNFIFC